MFASAQHAFVGLAGGALGAMPTFSAAGTGANEAPVSGTLQVPYPAGIVAGQFLVCHVVARDATAAAITTPSGWSVIADAISADGFNYAQAFYKVADGTESGNLDVTCTAGTRANGRTYSFSSGSGIEAGSGVSTDSGGTGMSAVNVTTLGSNRLAVQLFNAAVNTTIGDISGESGADYTEAVAEYSTTSIIMSCQAASVAAAVAISGGSATLGASGTYRQRIGFAITP